MAQLTPAEIDEIAELVCTKLEKHRREWWVEPEMHYNQHKDITKVIDGWNLADTLIKRAFLGLVVLGGVTLAAIGLISTSIHKFFGS